MSFTYYLPVFATQWTSISYQSSSFREFSGIIMPMNENGTNGKRIRLTSLSSCAG